MDLHRTRPRNKRFERQRQPISCTQRLWSTTTATTESRWQSKQHSKQFKWLSTTKSITTSRLRSVASAAAIPNTICTPARHWTTASAAAADCLPMVPTSTTPPASGYPPEAGRPSTDATFSFSFPAIWTCASSNSYCYWRAFPLWWACSGCRPERPISLFNEGSFSNSAANGWRDTFAASGARKRSRWKCLDCMGWRHKDK